MNTRKYIWPIIFIWGVLLGIQGAALAESPSLMMATTTSTDNTGLLDYLSPFFLKETGIALKWTAVGTGKALELGKNCDVDVLLVHAPTAEKQYIEEGFGINRREIMYNDFVIIGPPSDPAGLKGKTVVQALTAIETGTHVFVSRGDNSGTHKKECALWKEIGHGVPEKASFYIQTGQGMMTTILIADEKRGYTLTDRGTYIKYEYQNGGKPALVILVEGDGVLKNQYSVIEVNPAHCLKTNISAAQTFSRWMAAKKTQHRIKAFTLLNKQLFTPNAK